jgi:hypothetical protein
MVEIFGGGFAVEYICRVVDETDGQESVPATPTMAQTNLNGKGKNRSGGKKSAADASDSKTSTVLNSSLQVAMPVLNGATDGIAGQVIGKSKQVLNVGKAIASGAGKAAIFGAIAPLIALGVAEAVQAYQNNKAKNDALAQSIDETNLKRQMAGLEKINYTRSKFTGKIRMEEKR